MAAAYRDALRTVEDVAERQVVQSMKGENVDVFGFFESGGDVAVCVLVVRGGVLQDRREFFFEKSEEVDPAAFLEAFLPQFYDANPFLPDEVHLPVAIAERGAARGVPGRAPRARRSPSASRSAGAAADRVALAEHQRAGAPPRPVPAAGRRGGARRRAARARRSTSPIPPHRIEAFDISHLQGTDSVASLVVFEDGKPQQVRLPALRHRLAEPARARRLPQHGRGRRAPLPPRRRRRTARCPTSSSWTAAAGQLQAALTALDRLGVELPVVGPRQARGGDLGARPARARSGSRARTRR